MTTSSLLRKIPIVGVMGSSQKSHKERAQRVGEWVAQVGYHLLTGGGSGVMLSVTQAFVSVPQRKGLAIGIIPFETEEEATKNTKLVRAFNISDVTSQNKVLVGAQPSGYPNPYIEIADSNAFAASRCPLWWPVFTQPYQHIVFRCDHYIAWIRGHFS